MASSKQKLTPWYLELFHRNSIIRNLEALQDFIVISLGICLLAKMLIVLGHVFLSLLKSQQVESVTSELLSDVLFLLILVELFRLLVIYLQQHRISVEVAVEVAIVSALREIIVHGVLEISWQQILAICAFLLVMGALLLICHQTPYGCDLPSLVGKSSPQNSNTND